jgi:hypothetical protein
MVTQIIVITNNYNYNVQKNNRYFSKDYGTELIYEKQKLVITIITD